MNYAEVLDQYNEIAAAKGKAKHPLIIAALKTPDLVRVTQYILDPRKTFKISKIKGMSNMGIPQDLFEFLDYLNAKKGATDKDRRILADIASESEEKFTIVNKILRHKTDAGFTNNTMNKLAHGLIPYYPYMRCKSLSYLKNIKFPCFSQLKADGMYHEPKTGIYRTRNGNILDFSLVPTSQNNYQGKLMGECLMLKEDGSGFIDRRDGNAIINKAQYSGLSQEEADRIRFQYWDIDTGEASITGYEERFAQLVDMVGPDQLIESRIVNNMEEAWEHYDEVRARGLEGTILKNLDGFWKDGDSQDQVKLKAEKECELDVFDIVPGKDKYEGMVGSLCCRASCGQLVTNIGMGLTDEDRERTDWIGQIITVKFNEISKSKNKTTWAMSHGRLIEPRMDKTEADDLEYIKAVKEVKR